ncbi:MAG: hypothetical protein KF770_09420 [Anaerolineae bacterium]|nr:hypothetical protein [Anaerolineae bacterium]
MGGILDKLGKNYLIATFIPSLGFVLLGYYIFRPILPPSIKEDFIISLDYPLIGGALLVFVLTLILGYILQGLNIFILKLTEGYFVLEKLGFVRRRQLRKAIRRKSEIKRLEITLEKMFDLEDTLEQRNEENPRLTKAIDTLVQYKKRLEARYRVDYPSPNGNILPTRFGNILRSAESYPNEQYKIDSVVMWPRLIYVMNPTYYDMMDQSNNGLSFLINSMLLAGIMAILCVGASFYQFSILPVTQAAYEIQAGDYFLSHKKQPDEEAQQKFDDYQLLYFLPLEVTKAAQRAYVERAWLYLIASGLFVGVAIFFYNASLPAARQYGNMIRSAYDLFRLDLMRTLKLPQPANLADEKHTWFLWTEFVTLGSLPEAEGSEQAVEPEDPLKYQYKWEI